MTDPAQSQIPDWYGTPRGRRAARLLAAKLAPLLKGSASNRLLALGVTAPVLVRIHDRRHERRALVTGLPATRWPTLAPNCTCVADYARLPFAEAMFDDALLIHSLEFAAPPRTLLREVWRVLAPAGRLIVVVPNRGGPWAWSERTPFGHGHPYSRGALSRLLAEALFEGETSATALAAPPVNGLRWLETPLAGLLTRRGGVHVVTARKTDGLGAVTTGAAAVALRPAAATR